MSNTSLIDDVVAERGFPGKFSPALIRAAKRAVLAPQRAAREDFRRLRMVTIDGAEARDFDDAVACVRLPDEGFRLWVAIADVAAFVGAETALDQEARRRGNSVYLPDRVLPMLPPALSDEVCSLNPGEDKMCLVCEMEIYAGEVRQYRFARGLMHSQRRLVYEEAAAEMRSGAKYLRALAAVSETLRQTRRNNGAFMMERPESQISLAANGEVQVQENQRNIAHLAIEECMIAANRCAADFVICRGLPALHRIHKKPPAANIAKLRGVLAPLGIAFSSNPAACDFSTALAQISAHKPALADCLLPLLLGALARAEYAADSKTGHFGLACSRYLHFTSPIRRYPDLLVHRAIIAGLVGEKPASEDLSAIGAHCSASEVAADKAGWECRQRLLCRRAQQQVGMEFDGIISGTKPFGFFITVAELGLDGMVRLASLSGFWHYDCGAQQFTRRRGGQQLGLGSPLRVRLTAINAEKGRADFQVTAYEAAAINAAG